MKKPPRDSDRTSSKELVPLESRAVAKPTKAPSTWRAFNRFVADVDELLEYKEGLHEVFSQRDGVRTFVGIQSEAEFCQELVARCEAGLERFDHAENYEQDEDGECVLRHSHIAKRVGVLVASFPNANPSDVEGYVTMLVEHIGGTAASELSLETACREIVEKQKFAPAISEVLSVIERHIELWRNRLFAIRETEGLRLAAFKKLVERARKWKEEEHARKVETASFKLKCAIDRTRRCAQDIAAKEAELAKLRNDHQCAEQHESELRLRWELMTGNEQQAATKLDGVGCGQLPPERVDDTSTRH